MGRVSRVLARAKEIYDATHTEWLESTAIGINVKLYYPPTYEACNNCETNTYGTIYKAGGPISFQLGQCPMCMSDTCQKEVEQTEVVRLRIYSVDSTSFSRATFKKLGISIDQPQGELLTIGSVDDLTKIKSCNYAVFYSDQEGTTGSLRYKISTDPQPHGFGKDKFFFCFWTRV